MAQQYTKKRIREVFIDMLNDIPIKDITVKEIVSRCEINRNTFYYHYHDVYAVLTEIFEMEIQKVIDEYNDTLSWEEGFLKATSFAQNNKRAIFHVYHSIRKEELERYIFNVSGSVMERYVMRRSENINASKEDIKLIAFLYQSALTQMVMHWIAEGMKEDPEKIIRRVGELFDGNIELSLRRSEALKKDT